MFNKYKKEIEELKKSIQEKEELIKKLKKSINNYTRMISNLESKIDALRESQLKIQKENEIMKKYYKLDEELSDEVQAKVLINLRLHDMEMQLLRTNQNLTNSLLDYRNSNMSLASIYNSANLGIYRQF